MDADLEKRARELLDDARFTGKGEDWMAAAEAFAAALSAGQADARRWRHARRILAVEDIEEAQRMFDEYGVEGDEFENLKADAAIDAAIAASGERNG